MLTCAHSDMMMSYVGTADGGITSNMTCSFNDSGVNADAETATLTMATMSAWKSNASESRPFFLASGFQGPRLPWSYPASVAARYRS